MDKFFHVSCGKIPQNRSFIEIGQIGHILAHVEFGWIDLTNHILLVLVNLRYNNFIITIISIFMKLWGNNI